MSNFKMPGTRDFCLLAGYIRTLASNVTTKFTTSKIRKINNSCLIFQNTTKNGCY